MMPEISLNILDVAENSVRAGASLIEITVSVQPASDTLTVVIKDNGCGMTEQQQATMWEQGISGFGSSGLGLAFVKQTVEAMDGSVISESQPGKGTRFIIFLPEVVNHGTKDYDTFH